VIGFDELCSYSHEVLSATWDEAGAVWRVEVKDLHTGKVESDWCHVLVNGNGPLNRPKLPEIEGLKDFKGEILHTARWPEGKDLRGKRVAAIGCGSSGALGHGCSEYCYLINGRSFI
jgi:cation diffusion facilitator CzcD-associated flavoprotein CzcO